MNIALVNPEYPSPSGLDHGGIATYTYTFAEACAQQGHRVHVLVKTGVNTPPLPPAVTVTCFAPAPPRSPLRFIHRKVNGNVYWERCFSIGLKSALLAIHEKEPLDVVEIPNTTGCRRLRPSCPFPS